VRIVVDALSVGELLKEDLSIKVFRNNGDIMVKGKQKSSGDEKNI
jgi:hypothetical protein